MISSKKLSAKPTARARAAPAARMSGRLSRRASLGVVERRHRMGVAAGPHRAGEGTELPLGEDLPPGVLPRAGEVTASRDG